MLGFGDMLLTFEGTAVIADRPDWTTDTAKLLVSTDCTVVMVLMSCDITYVMAGELSPVEFVDPTEFKLS